VKQVCIIYDPFAVRLILNPSLLSVPIRDSGGNTFASIDNKPLSYMKNRHPFRRLLNFHAKCAYRNALRNLWITQEVFRDFKVYDHVSIGALDPMRMFSSPT